MTTLALRASDLADAPKLRLLGKASSGDTEAILVAGDDSTQRAAVLDELSDKMPQDTTFEQAGAVWEVLARAPSSRMVVLSGELDDVPAPSLMRMLEHRHPGLPVVSLGEPAPAEL